MVVRGVHPNYSLQDEARRAIASEHHHRRDRDGADRGVFSVSEARPGLRAGV